MTLHIDTDPARLDRERVYRYLSEQSYWARQLPRDIFERSLDHSLCFGAYAADGEQIGFARVITDYATFAYLADVFVVEAWRGQGVSKQLMAAIDSHPGLQNLRRMLLATADAHGLYAQFGFSPLSRPEWMMEKRDADIYQRLAANPGSAA